VRFKIDENLPSRLKTVIQQAGHEESTVHGEGLAGADDSRIMEACREAQLALLTLDLDFANIIAYPSGSHHGVLVVRPGGLDAGTVEKVMKDLLESADLARLEGSTVIVEPGRLRVRGPARRE